MLEDSPAWGFELKTYKNVDGHYSKDNIGQCHNHGQWLKEEHGDNSRLAVVGLLLPVSEKANPSPHLRIIDIDATRDLAGRVARVLEAVESGDKANLEIAFQTWLDHFGLNFPMCVEALESRLAVDLKES